MPSDSLSHDSQQHLPPPVPRKRGRSWRNLVLAGVLVVGGGVAVASIVPRDASHSLKDVLTHTVARGDLDVTVTEQGTLESANNTEIKCRVRGDNTLIWVVESGTIVEPGDELARLETLLIEEEISERTKFAHLARSSSERARADVARSEIAISQYLEGQFVAELATLKKDLAISESNLVSAKNMLSHSKMMVRSEYASELEVEEREFALEQAELTVSLNKTRIDVLKRFTKKEQLATLQGALNAAKANYEAEKERTYADEQRLARAKEEYELCVITADRAGLVIYPTGKAWGDAPDIEEGATVHKDQVLLLMPDLSQMQVKVGIHESVIDRIEPGQDAIVTLPKTKLKASVSTVASVAKPAGWWTGNVVKYDTIVALPESEGLKPGMSVEVEVVMARHRDVLLIPTSAVLDTLGGHLCWVKQGDKAARRPIEIGDGSDSFLVVHKGLAIGEEVIIDPLANVPDAQAEAAAQFEAAKAKPSSMIEF